MPPIIAIVGSSGSGKTTFMVKLIPELTSRGLKVGTIKHDPHGFEMDHPGKDSWRHKQAGSVTSIISSPHRIGMVMDVDHDHSLDELARFFSGVDMILCEGFKRTSKPKVEVFRSEIHDRPLCLGDENLIALVCDEEVDAGVRRFSTGEVKELADLLIARLNLHQTSS